MRPRLVGSPRTRVCGGESDPAATHHRPRASVPAVPGRLERSRVVSTATPGQECIFSQFLTLSESSDLSSFLRWLTRAFTRGRTATAHRDICMPVIRRTRRRCQPTSTCSLPGARPGDRRSAAGAQAAADKTTTLLSQLSHCCHRSGSSCRLVQSICTYLCAPFRALACAERCPDAGQTMRYREKHSRTT